MALSLVLPRICGRLAGSLIIVPALLKAGVSAPVASRAASAVPSAVRFILDKIANNEPLTPEQIETVKTIRARDAQAGYRDW